MKIKDKIYNIKRKKALNLITNNLGLVKEKEDEIICYVNKDKIEVNGANLSLSCYGIKDEHKKIAQKYNIDKPIHYVIKDLLITNKIYIFGYENCNVEIKNCSLKNDAGIHINGNLILDKTYIKTAPYILISAKDITLKNINDEDLEATGQYPNINFYSENNINIINSNINPKNKNSKISLYANNIINILNSNIKSKEIQLEANKINSNNKNNALNAEEIEIKTKNLNKITLNAKHIILNDEELNNKKDELQQERIEFLNLLKETKKQKIRTLTK